MSALPVQVGAKGRVVLPAPMRRALDIEEGTELLARVQGDAIVLEPRRAALARARRLLREAIPGDARLVDELIAERRAEAARERRP